MSVMPLFLRRMLIKTPRRTKLVLLLGFTVAVLLILGSAPLSPSLINTASEFSSQPALRDDASERRSMTLEDNLVMGVATGASASELRVFLKSINLHAPTAKVVLLVDMDAPMSFPPPAEGLKYTIQTVMTQTLQFPWNSYQPSSWRYLQYRKTMDTATTSYRKVLLTDVRDVAFQADPFQIVKDTQTLHVFNEWIRSTIGNPSNGQEDHSNRDAIEQCFGRQAVEALQSRSVCNSGFVIGSFDVVSKYVNKMLSQLESLQKCERRATDQAILNYLLHTGQLDAAVGKVAAHDNEKGPVAALKYVPGQVIQINPEGIILNTIGEPYVAVHQWGVHEAVATALLRAYPEPKLYGEVSDEQNPDDEGIFDGDEEKSPFELAIAPIAKVDWSSRRRVVLGYAKGRSFDQIALFVVSLRSAIAQTMRYVRQPPQTTDIVIFAERDLISTLEWIAIKYNVQVEPTDNSEGRVFPKTALFRMYLNQPMSAAYTDIFATDVGETYFQADPFFTASEPVDVHIFNENESVTIGQAKLSTDSQGTLAESVVRCYSDNELAEMKQHVVSSPGVVLGGLEGMKYYLGLMSTSVLQMESCTGSRLDDAVHNFLIVSGLIVRSGARLYVHENEDGYVCNYEYAEAGHAIRDEVEGSQIINRDNEMCGVVHEFIANPKVASMFEKKHTEPLREARAGRDAYIRKKHMQGAHKPNDGGRRPMSVVDDETEPTENAARDVSAMRMARGKQRALSSLKLSRRGNVGVNGARSRRVALGMATGLDPTDIIVFTNSLAQQASDADIVLFVDVLPQSGVLFPPTVQFVPVDMSTMPEPWSGFHPSNSRYQLYSDWLDTANVRGVSYDAVLISDVRDVLFQADPFAVVTKDAVYVFEEDARVTIGNGGGMQNLINRDWIAKCYGKDEAVLHDRKKVVCSGVTVGSGAGMRRYLDAMTTELVARHTCEANGVDQGIHNQLIHSGRLAAAVVVIPMSNERGPVLTMAFLRPNEVPSGTVADEPITNEDGQLYAILHQYDRHKDIAKSIRRRFA